MQCENVSRLLSVVKIILRWKLWCSGHHCIICQWRA